MTADGGTRYGLHASSVMDTNAAPDRVFWTAGWGAYDQAALTWLYGGTDTRATTTFLYCDERHAKYTPLCRPGDLGTTPSEILANDIDTYEWQFAWRNQRQFHKIWDDTKYADGPLDFVTELRRFNALGGLDLAGSVYQDETAHAAALADGATRAVMAMTAIERPYATQYDPAFGDVTQQGIMLDKLFAMQAYFGAWPVVDYDPTRTAGTSVIAAAEAGADTLLPGYDAFPWARPIAVAQFLSDTRPPAYAQQRAWAGGRSFSSAFDLSAWFHSLAIQVAFVDPQTGVNCSFAPSCLYDPRAPRQYPSQTHQSDAFNEFVGPDGNRYIWATLPGGTALFCDRDRDSATYVVMRRYTSELASQDLADSAADAALLQAFVDGWR
jgi:hypothetical protein